MVSLNIYVSVLFFVLCEALSLAVSQQNEAAEYLWKIYKFALQSRKTHSHYPYPYSYKYPGKYPEYYQNRPLESYGHYPGTIDHNFHNQKYSYPYALPNKAHFHYKPSQLYGHPNPNLADTYPGSISKPKESIMEVLYSIARNDNLQCVPKLICEVTAGTMSGRQQGLNFPININMESLVGFLSVLNGAQPSPLLYFGKAALLGITSKGNTGTCSYAYPECPSDPDKVVTYLNNHNGGFFRYFNGGVPSQNYNQIPYWKKATVEQRIQNNVVDYPQSNYGNLNSVTFPREEYGAVFNFEYPHSYRAEKNLKFPNRDFDYNDEPNQNINELSTYSYNTLKFPSEENYKESIRKPKKYHNYEYNFDVQKPLPNHKATPMIFPIRTGTGDLRLDPEELQDHHGPVAYEDDDVRVIFNEDVGDGVNPDPYYDRYRYGRGFTFPS